MDFNSTIKKPFTVTELVNFINRTVKNVDEIVVEGEIGTFTNHRSGHWYFSLKDAKCKVECTMWSSVNRQMSFVPAVGQMVRVHGELDFYGPFGKLSVIARLIERGGEGELLAKFIALKKKLYAEGLFNKEIKRPIPMVPRTIGIIAGANTAALKDAVTRLVIQAPYAAIVIYPALVQGAQAVGNIILALRRAHREHVADVLLLIRGGGSLEDLWCFNDERLARAIRASRIPIVTGIGHSTDETIADYVADLWCQTPTQAANSVGTDKQSLLTHIGTHLDSITKYLLNLITSGQNAVGNASYVFGSPESIFADRANDVHNAFKLMAVCTTGLVQNLQKDVAYGISELKTSIALEEHRHRLVLITSDLKAFTNKQISELQLKVTYAKPLASVSLQIQEERASQETAALRSAYRRLLTTIGDDLKKSTQTLRTTENWVIKSYEQQAQHQMISSVELMKSYQDLLREGVTALRLCRPKPESTKVRQMASLLARSGNLSVTHKDNDYLALKTKFAELGAGIKTHLQAGYAQVRNKEGYVLSIQDVKIGEMVRVNVEGGSFVAQVVSVTPNVPKP